MLGSMQRAPTPSQPDVRDVSIVLNGRRVSVSFGTSVAAAIWNAGVAASRLSVRGEPRTALCGMGICHECRATINGVPHERTCLVDCTAEMNITTPTTL